MRLISSNGHGYLVDEQDASLVEGKKWCVHFEQRRKYKYVVNVTRESGRCRMVYLHRIITGAASGQFVDHINGDTLDNRRGNLRLCDNRLNQGNQRRVRGCVPIKGVTIENGHYRARIRRFGRRLSLGTYRTPIEAGFAYARAAVEVFGDHAYSNVSQSIF